MKYTKYTIIIAMLLGLAACTPTAQDVTDNGTFHLPKELRDCSVHQLMSSGGTHYTVFRCPSSTTSTTQHGKHPITTIYDEVQ